MSMKAFNISRWLPIFLLLVFTACDTLQQVPKKDKDDPKLDDIEGNTGYKDDKENPDYDPGETGNNNGNNGDSGSTEDPYDYEDVDTVTWETMPDNYPPGDGGLDPKDPGDTNPTTTPGTKVFLDQYRVAMVMPFLTNRGSVDGKSVRALDFYAGASLALDKLETEGLNMKVTLHDSEGSESRVRTLLTSSDLTNANMIIGPVGRSALRPVAEFVKNTDKTLISPFNPLGGITSYNPNYVQVSPYLKTHCEVITDDVRRRFKPEQVTLICRNKSTEVQALEYFQNANARTPNAQGNATTTRFKEYIIGEKEYSVNVSPYFYSGDTTVFVIPSWGDETFIMNVLRRIYTQKGNRKIVVYGMPRWMEYERVTYKYYEDLNVHVTSAAYVDEESQATKDFARQFFQKYGKAPTLNAYVGYDTTLYFGRQLKNNGTTFRQFMEVQPESYFHTKFSFQPVVLQTSDNFSENQVYQYENKFVNILKFDDYYFKIINR